MEFNKFQQDLLIQLKLRNKSCIQSIEQNKILIQENLGYNGNLETIKKFVTDINDIIVENEDNFINIIVDSDKSSLMLFKNKYDLIERVLKHPYFHRVLDEFIDSDVLIRACKEGNKNAVKWLLTMNINPYLQDENGISALMYAAEQDFEFVIKPYLNDRRCINLEDSHGENVLFYCLRNPKFSLGDVVKSNNKFQMDLIENSKINMNQVNHQGETVLTYCIKNDIIEPIYKFLLQSTKLDVNIADNDGKTAAMYLTEKGLYNELLQLHFRDCNYDYIDMKGESVMSILLNKLYSAEDPQSEVPYENYVLMMNGLVQYQIDFNYPMDDDDNTIFMNFLIVNDMETAEFCAENLERLDLSIKNKYGESATSLCYKLNYSQLLPLFKNNPTFDDNYRDPLNQNTLLMISAINNPQSMKNLLENDPSIINDVNSYQENALIIAIKAQQIPSVEILLKCGINVNHQDHLGNTALHYAIEIQDLYLVHKLMNKKPDLYLKNNEGKTPLDYVNRIENQLCKEMIINLLMKGSHKAYHNKLNRQKNKNRYLEDIKKYLIPYANNYYPDYKSTKKMERIKKDMYNRNKGVDKKKEVLIVLILIIFTVCRHF